MKKKLTLIISILFIFTAKASSAILLEDSKTTLHPSTSVKSFSSFYEMRRFKRVGIGLALAGINGLYGTNIELNFTPQTSLVTGFGGGSNFQSFSFAWKNSFYGQYIVPYTMVGYARWYTFGKKGETITETNPSYLAQQFLDDEQKKEGQFSKDFLAPTFGLQYVQLAGPWIGTSVFAEIALLMDLSSFASVPTGEIGFRYYF